MKKVWIKKRLIFVTFFIAATVLVSFIVMGLWNTILPAVLGVKVITFAQALGILLLSKILFGGFRGGCYGNGRQQWKMKIQEKMGQMTAEEKEKFKAEWKSHCASGFGMNRKKTSDITE